MRKAIVGLIILGIVIIAALFAENLAPFSPYFKAGMMDLGSGRLEVPPFAPGPLFKLGTDRLGRDLLSLIIYGARYSLLLGLVILACRFALAIPAAFAALSAGPKGQRALERAYQFTNALPPLIIYILFLGLPIFMYLDDTRALAVNVIALTILEWPRLALPIYGWVESLSHADFVEGAIAAGLSRGAILRRHLTPHLVGPLTALVAAEMGRILLLSGQLGLFKTFLGGGMWVLIDPSVSPKPQLASRLPEWGALLAEARHSLYTAPWNLIVPALALFFTIFAFHLVAEGFSEFYDKVGARIRVWLDRYPAERKWQVAMATLTVASLLYFQGLPFGDSRLIYNNLSQRTAALAAGDEAAFLKALDRTASTTYRNEQAALFQATTGLQQQVELSKLKVKRNEAIATVRYTSPLGSYERDLRYVKRWGLWREAGEGYDTFRTQYGLITSYLKINDPETDNQGLINHLGQVVDTEARRLELQLPGLLTDQLLPVTLYPTPEHLQASVGPADEPMVYHWAPGQSLKLAPSATLTGLGLDLYELVQEGLLSHGVDQLTRSGEAPLLRSGLMSLYAFLDQKVIIHGPTLEGRTLLSLADLTLTEWQSDLAIRMQAGLFMQYLLDEVGGAGVVEALRRVGGGASEQDALAATLGQPWSTIVTAYDAYVTSTVEKALTSHELQPSAEGLGQVVPRPANP